MNSFQTNQKNGLTIVELLVAISILTIVTALLIPRLRIVNEDRNIRETARIVGSAFSTARTRAIGTAQKTGVIIERNLNFVSQTSAGARVYYAGSRLTQMEAIFPPLMGDDANDFVMTTRTMDSDGREVLQCLIDVPLAHEPANGFPAVLSGDELIIDAVSYIVKEVLAPRMLTFRDSIPGDGNGEQLCGITVADSGSVDRLMLPLNIVYDNDTDPDNALDLGLNSTDFLTGSKLPDLEFPDNGADQYDIGPNFNCSTDYEFCQLRRVSSSVVDLPSGYLIDLRYSGQFDSGAGGGVDMDNETFTLFGLGLPNGVDETARVNREIQLSFDATGAVDSVFVNGGILLINSPVNLFINEFNPDDLLAGSAAQAQLLLNKPNALWVSVGTRDGTNVAYNIPPGTGTVDALISSATTFTRNGSSAAQ